MPGTVTYTSRMTNEERQNLLYRLRRISFLHSHPSGKTSYLRIDGKAVKSKPPEKETINFPSAKPRFAASSGMLSEFETGRTTATIRALDPKQDYDISNPAKHFDTPLSQLKRRSSKIHLHCDHSNIAEQGEGLYTNEKAEFATSKTNYRMYNFSSSGDFSEQQTKQTKQVFRRNYDKPSMSETKKVQKVLPLTENKHSRYYSSNADSDSFPVEGAFLQRPKLLSNSQEGKKVQRKPTIKKLDELQIQKQQSKLFGSSKGNKRKRNLIAKTTSTCFVEKCPSNSCTSQSTSTYEEETLDESVVRKFENMPDCKPKNVCFDFPGVDLTFADVKEAIENRIPDAFTSGKVVSIQFENINIKLGTGLKKNRWHIELKDFGTRNKLIKSGLEFKITQEDKRPSSLNMPLHSNRKLKKEQVPVHLYDEVILEEYKEYLKTCAGKDQLQNAILLCAGRGNKLLFKLL